MVDVELLVPNPRNPNKHPESQIKLLAKIMKHQGWRSPIVVSNRSGFITKGHGRLQAAILNKWSEVPVDRQDYENEADEYADMVADNKIAELSDTDLSMVLNDVLQLGPDFDFDLLGIPDFKLPEEFEPLTDEDEVPGLPVDPITKRGDVWQLGRHRLMCGDATSIDDVDRLLHGAKIDMVFTDPPYGINAVGKGGKVGGCTKHAPAKTYRPVLNDHDTECAKECYQLICALEIPKQFIWGGNYFTDFLPPSPCWLVWDKERPEGLTFADGEMAWTNLSSPLKFIRHRWDGYHRASEKKETRVHPTQKPAHLAEWTFKEYGKDGDHVLDLFGGSGSTLIACEKAGRSGFILELDPAYCDVIIKRWENYTGKKAELING